MKKIVSLLTFAAILACGSPNNKAFEELQQEEKIFYTKYKSIELTKEESIKMTDSYKRFLKAHPNFEGNDEILLRFADVYMGTKQYFLALGVYDQFTKKFPDHKKSAYALFSKGFACELAYKESKFSKHRDFSKDFYNRFLKKYPKHTLAKSVKVSLTELDKLEPKISK